MVKPNYDWIKEGIGKPGALHKALNVPVGKKLPMAKLKKAAEGKGKLATEAQTAIKIRGFKNNNK